MQNGVGVVFIQADQGRKSGRLGKFLKVYDSFFIFNALRFNIYVTLINGN